MDKQQLDLPFVQKEVSLFQNRDKQKSPDLNPLPYPPSLFTPSKQNNNNEKKKKKGEIAEEGEEERKHADRMRLYVTIFSWQNTFMEVLEIPEYRD